ncbi:glycosyltransferase family protein [Desulfovibrio sp. TomC]|uniref:glycosyltransferase family protein n=1 Tax=Desulfovibrio sp. TomC TaxID=1562888 RepID=UPI00057519AF|nr:glycosyltransferase [Desulfovibrio sp. TomC]KHK02927.1 hypothetical protein NY78_1456 [Desulfovibrio sp. TomC]
MEHAKMQCRTPFPCPAEALADPGRGLGLARTLWSRNRREMALDVYDQLAQAHPGYAVPLLAEAYDRMREIDPPTRYTLYQSRFFDFAIAPGDTVLDIGSGHMPFPLSTHLADISLTDGQVGRAGAAFRHVDGKPAYEVRVENTGFADKQFDFVYCSHVLEHVSDPTAACRELMRIAKRGYIETPTKGKDTLMGSARVSNHRWHVERLGETLVFTEYEARDLAGFGVDILMNMHINPRTDREKAFSALIWLRADQCNTMLAWDGSFDFEVRRPAAAPRSVHCATTTPPRPAPEPMPEAPQAPRPLRLMQVHTFYADYLHAFYSRRPGLAYAPYAEQVAALRSDGFSAVHLLAEHLGPLGYEAQLVVANNLAAQHAWAFEQGLADHRRGPSQEDILLAQVEAFAPDVLYLSDPITFDAGFVRKLSPRPRLVVGWRAANIPHTWDATEFDLILSNLAGLRDKALAMGARDAAHFHPGFPESLLAAVKDQEPTHDVCFCGQINASQYRSRNARLHLLANGCAQGRFGLRLNLSGHLEAATPLLRAANTGPCFGLDMYRALRSGRIVFDARGDIGLLGPDGAAHDLAGRQTANMRIFETTGVGAFLLTEHFDNVEEYFQPGREIETYADDRELLEKIDYYLKHEDQRLEIAARGLARCRKQHSIRARARDFDALIRERLVASPGESQTALFAARPSPEFVTAKAAVLTQKLERLAFLGSVPEDAVRRLLGDITPVTKALLQADAFQAALALTGAAKALQVPVNNLEFLRALAFLALDERASAREALTEELRLFPDNAEARAMLLALAEEPMA